MSSTVEKPSEINIREQFQQQAAELLELVKETRAHFDLLPIFKTKRRITEVTPSKEETEEILRQKRQKHEEEPGKKVDNLADLKSRLSSFTFLYHYLPRPLSALECAKHGWKDTKCVSKSDENIVVLACDDCQSEMFVIDVDLDKLDSEKASAIREKYKNGLYDCHKEDCIWRHDQCEDKVYCLPIFSLSEGVDRFESEAKNIITACQKNKVAIPEIKHELDEKTLSKVKYFTSKYTADIEASNTEAANTTAPNTETSNTEASNNDISNNNLPNAESSPAEALTTDNSTTEATSGEVSNTESINIKPADIESAYLLSLYGWKSLSEEIPGVHCDLCFTRMGFSDCKKDEVFNVLEEHKPYCPWRDANTARTYTPKLYSSTKTKKISGVDWMKDVISIEHSMLSRRECLSIASRYAADEKYDNMRYQMYKSYDLLKKWKSTIEQLENEDNSQLNK